MPPVKKPAKPGKPNEPKKPSSRSKTKNAECSQAASTWQLSLRGKATATAETYQTLAKCRALASSQRKADAYGRTGKLSEQGKAALESRLQSRFESGLITDKSRKAKLADLLAKRKAAQGATGVVAKSATTAENKGTYGDYYFTPDGKYVQMSGSGGMGSNRVGARDINGKMIGWYDRKELRFANEKQRTTRESEEASERLLAISKEVSDLREKNARLLIGRDTTDKLKRELARGSISKDKYDDLVQKGYVLSEKDYEKSREIQKQIESVKSRLSQPAPTPPKYSLGGQLAPGRGTAARKQVADIVRSIRTADPTTAAGVLKSAGVVAIPSKFDDKKIAIKERDMWNAYSPRQAANRLLINRTLAGQRRKGILAKRAGLTI